VTVSPSDDGLGRLLGVLPREAPPDVPLERILGRVAARRRNLAMAGVGAATAVLLLALLLSSDTPEPPVHLHLKVINILEPPPASRAAEEPPEVHLP
jgi:hypothetical protein